MSFLNKRYYVPVFAVTLFLSAALLFSVQPMFSKMILPRMGGTPQVWNTAMLFFQTFLLLGYAYAHGIAKVLNTKLQVLLHVILLFVFLYFLPIALPDDMVPPPGEHLGFWQIGVMLVTVGGPFFIISGSAPLLQRWFAHTDHEDSHNPYFLYGASNLGSMLSLLAYPFVIEPTLTTIDQSFFWAVGYGILIALTIICGGIGAAINKEPQQLSSVSETKEQDIPITWTRRALWLVLAFIPSSMMLGVTTYITTDIASVPLLWIVPLAIYVGTFIIVFARKPIIQPETATKIFGYLMIITITQAVVLKGAVSLFLIPLHLALFASAALSCHFELARTRPSAKNLTEFYLIMSLGGALGGFFNSIIAVEYIIIPVEYAVALTLAALFRFASNENKLETRPIFIYCALVCITSLMIVFLFYNKFTVALGAVIILASLGLIVDKRWLFGISVAIALTLFPPGYSWDWIDRENIRYQDRNFFGVLKVVDRGQMRAFMHGTTMHGNQALVEEHKLVPLSYYGPTSPVNDVFNFLDKEIIKEPGKQQDIAIMGLGVGVTACYQADGRYFTFYEIDPDVVKIAENPNYFTFLSDCGSPYEIKLGDGRIMIGEAEDNKYDLILMDTFSSDNVPAHMLTIEATKLFLSKLKTNGILIFNVSNRHLDIEPIIHEIAKKLDIMAYAKLGTTGTLEGTDLSYESAHFVVLTNNEAAIEDLKAKEWTKAMPRLGVSAWTDKFSNIVSVIYNRTLLKRVEMIREKQAQEKEQEESKAEKTEQ